MGSGSLMGKRKVHLVQINHKYGNAAFLPYSVGSIWAYVATDPTITANYELDGFTYLRDPIKEVVSKLPHDLDVLGLSCYIWNASITHALAKAAKERFPDCLIVMGGPHIPDRSDGYFADKPYIDVLIHDEGEEVVADVLKERLESKPDYSKVLGVTVNESGVSRKTATHPRIDDLDKLPSPYLAGWFDDLMPLPYEWLLTQEASRGCLVKGTRINTINGSKPIESVSPGELVLGWDEKLNQLVWNSIRYSVKTGTLPTLQINVGDQNVRATADHPFYTKRGWVAAEDLRTGDMVLQCLRQQKGSEGVLNMFGRVSGDCRSSTGVSTGGETARQVFGKKVNSDLQDVSKGVRQSWSDYLFTRMQWSSKECLASGTPKNASSEILQGLWGRNAQDNWKIKSPYMLREMHQRSYKQGQTGGTESGQMYRSEGKNISYGESDGTRVVCKDNQTASRGQNTLLPSSWRRPQQVRGQSNRVFEDSQIPISICGLWGFLGGSLPERTTPQSRFHTYQLEKENRCLSSRSVLAQQRGSGLSKSISRLYQLWLEGICDLGLRKTRREYDDTTPTVSWAEVKSISDSSVCDVYDLVGAQPYPNFFANGILVHNCPYQCEFCSWGSAVFTKLRKFSVDRLQGEFEWAAKHRVEMLYSADSNWAIFDRDVDITERMIKVKEKYGYPKKFRAAYAKNSNDRVFQVSKMLNDAGMSKGTTLSFQSMDEHTLEVVKRKNMKVNDFKGLMRRYSDAGIPTYSEMICGLPGETYESWAVGFDKLLSASASANINCYSCEILPNAGMGDPEYQAKHGIKSVETPVLFFHASKAKDEPPEVTEHYHIVTSTGSLSPSDWLKSQLLAWSIQAFMCMGPTQKLALYAKYRHQIAYRAFYEGLIEWAQSNPDTVLSTAYDEALGSYSRLRRGLGWGFQDSRFGDIIWPVEEGGFLICASDADRFYKELESWLTQLMPDDPALSDAITLQRATLKLPTAPPSEVLLGSNMVDYLDSCYKDNPIELIIGPTTHKIIDGVDYGGDLERFSREITWYGRKGGHPFWSTEKQT